MTNKNHEQMLLALINNISNVTLQVHKTLVFDMYEMYVVCNNTITQEALESVHVMYNNYLQQEEDNHDW